MRGFDYVNDAEALMVLEQQAAKVARQFGMDAFDLEQEAHIFVSTKLDIQEALADGNYGLMAHRLRADLLNYANKAHRAAGREVSLDDLEGGRAFEGRLFDDLATTGFRGGSGQ